MPWCDLSAACARGLHAHRTRGARMRIGITFRQGKEYDFTTDYADEVKADIESAVANGDSVGSLIADLRREGTLTAVTTA